MTPDTPYLFVEIWVPKRAPYNHAVHGWPSIVGDFVKPLADAYPGSRIWALQEGRHFQICFAAPRAFVPEGGKRFIGLVDMQLAMREIARKRRFQIKRYIYGSTLGGALAGSRWLPVRKQRRPAEKRRSFLLTRACHAVCAVYLDSLVRKGNHWVVESPQCQKQNPHGNLFESFMHLCANLSEARFDVQLKVRTRWMHDDWQDAKVICHL